MISNSSYFWKYYDAGWDAYNDGEPASKVKGLDKAYHDPWLKGWTEAKNYTHKSESNLPSPEDLR
jgi:hypothetical protein